MANKTFWTRENRARLDAMVRKGALLVTIQKAAEILGTSFSTVQSEITRQGIKATGRHTFAWTEERLKMLRAMVDTEGELILPRANAAKVMGCDRSTLITGLIKLQGEVTQRVDPARLKALATHDGQLTIKRHEAAKKLKCTEKSLRRAMRDAGIRGTQRFSWTPEKISQQKSMTERGHLTANRIDKRIPPPPENRVRPPSAVGHLLIVMRRWLPRVTPVQVTAALAAEPQLEGLAAEKLAVHLRGLGKIYRLSEGEALQMALSAPGLFVAKPAVLRRNLRAGADTMGMDAKEYAMFLRKKPALALIGAKDIQRRFYRLANFLGIDTNRAKNLSLRYPHLLIPSLDQLRTQTNALADALRLPSASIIAAARRQPNILRMSVELQARHCAEVARIFGADFKTVAATYIQSPSLLQVKPETIRTNIAEAARLLGCGKKELMASFLFKPPLLTMRPASIEEKVSALVNIFMLTPSEMTRKVLAYPYLLSFSAENTAEKAWLLVKLSEAVGKPATPAEILVMAPMAFSYGKERIAARVEMARAGTGYRNLGAMLSMSDAKLKELGATQSARSNPF